MITPTVKIKINKKELKEEAYSKLLKAKISSTVDAIDMAKVTFSDLDSVLQEDANFVIGKEISISIGFEEAEEVFIGEIIRIDYEFSVSTKTIELICYDKLFKLSKIRHSRPFVKMKDSDIAKKMASEAGLQSKITATKKKHEYIFQNNESNLDFLRRRAENLGYEISIEDGKMVFKDARHKDKKPSVTLVWNDRFTNFKVRIDGSEVVEEVVVTSWDATKKKNIEEKAKVGDEKKVVSPKDMGTKEVKKNLKNKSKVYKIDLPNLDNAEAKDIAVSKLTNASMTFLRGNGNCIGEPKIMAGKIIEIDNVGKKFSGEYYITSCEHIYSNRSYSTFFEVVSNGTFK